MPKLTDFDRHMMQLANRVARRTLGETSPNPAVGAVIANETTGELISRGWTQSGGRPHAETEAIRRAAPERTKGATLYVTLEPCAHHGATGPCADAIIAAGLKRVVIGTVDPDERTAGQGISKLEAAGIDIDRACEADTHWLTMGHILRITKDRPFVTLKLALSAAGDVPRGRDGTPSWATGSVARAYGHMLRAEADAILVGSGTVKDDNPDLTCRLPGLAHRSPIRIVLSRSLDVSPSSKLVQNANLTPTWIIGAANSPDSRMAELNHAGVHIWRTPADSQSPDLTHVLAYLAKQGITRLLVEGGPKIWRAFSEQGLVDEAYIFAVGNETSPEDLLNRHLPGQKFHLKTMRKLGPDYVYQLRSSQWEELCSQAS